MKIAILAIYLFFQGIRYLLRFLNLRHLGRHGGVVPPGFEGEVDPRTLRRTADYTMAQSRAGLVESIVGNILLLAFLFAGLLPLYDRWIDSFAQGFITAGLFFFLGLFLAQTVLDIPFSLYRNFVIESRFGFNAMGWRLWLEDLLKSTAIAIVLLGLLLTGALAMVHFSPRHWWLWVWAFFALVTIFLMYLSPVLIEPLFFKFEPVSREGLEDKIRELMQKAGLRVSRVMQVDASRRSRHSNAYFTGIGRVKRIVLFDTLLDQMTDPEVLAVLAHEVGHWKKGHIRKRIVLTELGSLVFFFIAWFLLGWGGIPGLIGLSSASFCAQVTILGFLASLAAFPLAPLSAWFSRRHEWQADHFARRLTGDPRALASALVKLSRENLSNLHPHPLYAWFHYSHPPVVARVQALRETEGGEGGSS
jgi:STE24 endopeptidase